MLKKGEDGRLKRIEYRGRHLRASRTGGVALRAQTRAAGLNMTVNSSRGVRLSRRVAKGTQVAFQNGRFVLRGRYGKGPTKLNLSKSGVSVSTKNEFGTINWFKPQYSSAKIGGIQVRGKNALAIMAITALAQLLYGLIVLVAQLLVLSLQLIGWLFLRLWILVLDGIEGMRERRLEAVEQDWEKALEPLNTEQLEAALDLVFLHLAKGKPLNLPEGAFADDSLYGQMEQVILKLLTSRRLNRVMRMELIVSCLAEAYLQKAGEAAALEQFERMDELAVREDQRNCLQERLLGAYATAAGIEIL